MILYCHSQRKYEGVIAIKTQFDARFLVTGNLEKVERVEYSNGTKELLKITVKAGEDYFTYTMFNTKKDPQRIRSLMTKLRKGDFVKASGTVSVNEYEDKQGNVQTSQNYSAFYTEHVKPTDHARGFVTIAGILKKKVDKEDLGGKEITIRVFDDFRQENNEYTLAVDEKMTDFFDDINEGDNITVTAEYINRSVADVPATGIKSYGEDIEGVIPAGMKRRYERKINVISGKILAEESELEDDSFFDIDNEDIPF